MHGVSSAPLPAILALVRSVYTASSGQSRVEELTGTVERLQGGGSDWLSYEYVRDPRHALEPGSAQRALLRGAHHVLHLLVPYLEPAQRTHLLQLARSYGDDGNGG